MADKKDRIKFLDDLISWFGRPPFRWKDSAKIMLQEIKGIVEQQDEFIVVETGDEMGEIQKLKTPSDLVEKINVAIKQAEKVDPIGYYSLKTTLTEIHKLLQSRQPEKLTITRGEIKALLGILIYKKDITLGDSPLSLIVNWLNSKGVKVVEK